MTFLLRITTVEVGGGIFGIVDIASVVADWIDIVGVSTVVSLPNTDSSSSSTTAVVDLVSSASPVFDIGTNNTGQSVNDINTLEARAL